MAELFVAIFSNVDFVMSASKLNPRWLGDSVIQSLASDWLNLQHPEQQK